MRIPLDESSPTPLYKQIQDFLREQIRMGILEPGARLPSSRQLAEELGVSRITVRNAYLDLESEALVTSWEGSGTYVRIPLHSGKAGASRDAPTWPTWQQEIAGISHLEGNTLNSTPTKKRDDLISFTGVGDPSQYPTLEFSRAMRSVIRDKGENAFNYGVFDGGYRPLRETLTQILASQGISAPAENVLITSGSQQALSLICQALLRPGDAVVVAEPTYNLAIELFHTLNLKIIGIPIDGDGMQVDDLETIILKHSPKLIYTIPNFQNPSGVCLSASRRRLLIDLADRYDLPIVEDDFVGDLRYDGRALPAVKALDPGGRVIYIGTFSKMLMPGLRLGYLVAEGPIYPLLAQFKRVTDLTSSPLLQQTLFEFVTVGRYEIHLRRSKKLYRKRRDAIVAAAEKHIPGMKAQIPSGGLFYWAALPEGISARNLLPYALDAGVEYAPGDLFFPNPGDGKSYLRMNFASVNQDAIEEGILRLASAIKQI